MIRTHEKNMEWNFQSRFGSKSYTCSFPNSAQAAGYGMLVCCDYEYVRPLQGGQRKSKPWKGVRNIVVGESISDIWALVKTLTWVRSETIKALSPWCWLETSHHKNLLWLSAPELVFMSQTQCRGSWYKLHLGPSFPGFQCTGYFSLTVVPLDYET